MRRLQRGKLRIEFSSNVRAIHEDHIDLEVADGTLIELPNDRVFIFAGGELPTRFLENAGIKITRRFGYAVRKHGNS